MKLFKSHNDPPLAELPNDEELERLVEPFVAAAEAAAEHGQQPYES